MSGPVLVHHLPYTEPLPSRSFCLVSDDALHINMLLGGYLDACGSTSAPATHPQKPLPLKAEKGGKGGKGGEGDRVVCPRQPGFVIRELAVMWGKAGPGQKQHVLRMGSADGGPDGAWGRGSWGASKSMGLRMPRILVRHHI